MTATATQPLAWITRNLADGFTLGTHTVDGDSHLTSLELGVAVVEATGEAVHYCHDCEDFADDHTVTIASFSNVVAHLGRQHAEYLADPNAGLPELRRLFVALHAATVQTDISHADADALLLDEIHAPAV